MKSSDLGPIEFTYINFATVFPPSSLERARSEIHNTGEHRHTGTIPGSITAGLRPGQGWRRICGKVTRSDG